MIIVVLVVAYYPMLDEDDPEASVFEAVIMLEKDRYQEFYNIFDTTLQFAIGDIEGLKAMWYQYIYSIGDFVEIERTEFVQSGTNTISISYCKYSECGLMSTMTTDSDGNYVGLFFEYYEPEDTDPLPSNLTETDLTVDTGTDYPLPGTLTSSISLDHSVAIVIVHGSNLNECDGTVGTNTPYCNIVRGLMEYRINVLTYDKRTYVYSWINNDSSRYTINDETVDDVVVVVTMLKEMGYDRVYVIGYSMGGMLALYIVQRCN